MFSSGLRGSRIFRPRQSFGKYHDPNARDEEPQHPPDHPAGKKNDKSLTMYGFNERLLHFYEARLALNSGSFKKG